MAKPYQLGRIDDEFDAVEKAYPEQSDDAALDVTLAIGEAASTVVAPLVAPLFTLAKEARDFFGKKATSSRLRVLMETLKSKLDALNDRTDVRLESLQSRVQTVEFANACREAVAQTVIATEEAKIKRFGLIVASATTAVSWDEFASEVPTLIKAIAQLDEKDIESLRILHKTFAQVIAAYPNMHDPNPFTEKMQDLMRSYSAAGFHPDDFYAHCRRLEGFGLAMEVLRNPSRMGLGDYCFRPTLKGLRLIKLLAQENH